MSADKLPVLHSVSEIEVMARRVASSRMFGMDESQAFTLMMICQAKGLHPIQAVERYHCIQGRPAMKADAILAEFQAHGGVIEWHQHDHVKCEATFTCPGVKTPTTVAWSIDDAKKAELTKNGMYTKYPRQMLRSRVISEGIRMTMPGILSGIYTPEEVADFEPVQARATLHEDPSPSGPQMASTNETRHFSERVKRFCDRVNYKWLDKNTDPHTGECMAKELVSTFQLTNHMLKEAGITFPDGGKHNDRMRTAAALWLQDDAGTLAGWKEYVAKLAAEAKAKLAGPQPEDESQEAELVAVEAPAGREPGCDDDFEEGVNC